jgi:hypothetical protein
LGVIFEQNGVDRLSAGGPVSTVKRPEEET